MGRIIGYQYDDNVQDGDAWIGSEDGGGRTKQYTAEAVANYLNIQGKISIVGQMTYKYGITPLSGPGTFAVFGGGTDPVAFSAITKLTLSNTDVSKQRVVEFLNLLVGSDILISKQSAISTFGYYSIDNYAVNATDPAYYDLGVTFKSGNGSMEAEQIYETQNFTLAAEENISTLQTTIDAGNTYQASPSGALWTWGAGEITTTSTSFTSILSGKRFKTTFIDTGSYTDVLPDQLIFNNASGNKTSVTPNTLLSNGIELQWPSASGTLALTTDITASPWDTVTGGINYANGNVGIGTTAPEHKLEVVGGNVHFQNTESSNTFLDVQGDDANAYIRAHSGSNSVWLYQGGSSSYLQAQAGSTLRLGSGTSNLVITNTSGEVMRISGSNVGIGTTSPSEKLEVSGGIIAETLFIRNGDGYNAKLLSDNLTFNRTFNFPDNEGTLAITSDIPSASQWDDVTGGINYANGNVGIGTTTPTRELDVIGQIQASDRVISNQLQARSSFGMVFKNSSGSDLMLMSNDGKLGIGTTSPGAKLEVSGLGNQKLLVNRTDGDNFFIDAQNGQIRLRGSSNIIMGVSADVLTVTNSNVGIGTTSPSTKLEIISAANEEGIAIKDSSGNLKYKVRQFGGNSYSTFWDSTNTEKVRITSGGSSFFNGGNVGIGTTSPSTTLDILGDYRQIYSPVPAAGGTPIARTLSYSVSPYGLVTRAYNNGLYSIQNEREANAGETFDLSLQPTGGNVGIGTTSPGQKLEVDGQVLSDGYRLAAMQTAPATRNSAGTLGEIVIDGNHIYVCYATDSWSRVALDTSW